MRLFALILLFALPARADTALIAVATNFRPVAERLAGEFNVQSGHEVRLSAGATGKLAAQIAAGGPYDAFLSADSETPAFLIGADRAMADSRFTYAIGRLALWSRDPAADFDDLGAYFTRSRHIAIANPALAPYGKAAMQTIENLKLNDIVQGKIVQGENIGQTFAMIHGGAAEAGFVAASALRPAFPGGTEWLVPEALHDPIEQQAVLLSHGRGNPAAIGFLAYLKRPVAKRLIESYGYGTLP